MTTYLLLKIKGGRKFLTHEKNLPSLIEFAKTFSAEIWRVEAEKQKVLELKTLAQAICNQDYSQNPDYSNPKKIYPRSKRDRDSILKNAAKIRKFIERKLTSGKAVSLKELKEKYREWDVTDACLCSHLSSIRKSLADQGYEVKKLAAGTYQLQCRQTTLPS